MARIQYIKDLFENEELSLRETPRRTNHSFNTVKKYAYQEEWGESELPNLESESYPLLGTFISIIDGWLETDRKVPRRQRHTMWRIIRHSAEIVRHDWKLLMREGHNGCNCMTS